MITNMILVTSFAEDFGSDEEEGLFDHIHPQWDALPKHARVWADNQLCKGFVLCIEDIERESDVHENTLAYRVYDEPQHHVAVLRQDYDAGTWEVLVSMEYKDRYGPTIHPVRECFTGTHVEVMGQIEELMKEYGYSLGDWSCPDPDEESLWEAILQITS